MDLLPNEIKLILLAGVKIQSHFTNFELLGSFDDFYCEAPTVAAVPAVAIVAVEIMGRDKICLRDICNL